MVAPQKEQAAQNGLPAKNFEKEQEKSGIGKFIYKYIFPGKLFPCYKPRAGENGEVLPPPTCLQPCQNKAIALIPLQQFPHGKLLLV